MRRLTRALGDSPMQRLGHMSKLYILNSLLYQGPTLAINTLSNSLMAVYRPIEDAVGYTWDAGLKLAEGDPKQARHKLSLAADEVQAMYHMVPFTETWWESARYALRVAKQRGQPILTSTHKMLEGDGRPQLSAAYLGLEDSPWARAIDLTLGVANIPLTALGTMDEFAKQMTFRMNMKKRLLRMAAEEGHQTPEDVAAFMVRAENHILVDGQKATYNAVYEEGYRKARDQLPGEDPERWKNEARLAADKWDEEEYLEQFRAISDRSAEVAEDVTFTRDLEEGTLGRTMQKAAGEHPVFATVFMPFIKTPVNLFGWAASRTAGNAFGLAEKAWMAATKDVPGVGPHLAKARSEWGKDLAAGGEARANALGRMAAGIALVYKAAELTQRERIQGRGPEDPDQRKAWIKAGNMPYSILGRDGNRYSFSRLDPFSVVIGAVADVVDFAKWAPREEREGLALVGASILTSVTNQLRNKPYLRGLGTAVDMLSGEQGFLEGAGRYAAAATVPRMPMQILSGFQTDPYMRETLGLMDRVKNRIPRLSRDLSPVRSVLGEPVHRKRFGGESDTPLANVGDMIVPLAYSPTSTGDSEADLVYQEMSMLNHAWRAPRAITTDNLDYREYLYEPVEKPEFWDDKVASFGPTVGQPAFDRLGELRGTIRLPVGRKSLTLKQALHELITSDAYKRLSPLSDPDGPSPRVQFIRRVINNYHQVSHALVKEEYPALMRDIVDRRKSRLEKFRPEAVK